MPFNQSHQIRMRLFRLSTLPWDLSLSPNSHLNRSSPNGANLSSLPLLHHQTLLPARRQQSRNLHLTFNYPCPKPRHPTHSYFPHCPNATKHSSQTLALSSKYHLNLTPTLQNLPAASVDQLSLLPPNPLLPQRDNPHPNRRANPHHPVQP